MSAAQPPPQPALNGVLMFREYCRRALAELGLHFFPEQNLEAGLIPDLTPYVREYGLPPPQLLEEPVGIEPLPAPSACWILPWHWLREFVDQLQPVPTLVYRHAVCFTVAYQMVVQQEIQSHPAAVMQFMIMQEQKYQAFMIFQLQVGAAIQRYTSLVQQRRYNAQELVQVLRIFIGRLEEYKERVRRVVYDRREEELDLWAEIVGGRVREDSL